MPYSTVSALRRVAALALLSTVGSAAMAGSPRPFQATLQITENVTLTYALPCFAIGTITATGTASHMGQVTAASQDCINPAGVPVLNLPMSFAFVSQSTAAGGSTGTTSSTTGLTFTAANGDRLFVSYSGLLTAQSFGAPHAVTGAFLITGGTGRFAGASGTGTVTGYEDISQGTSGFGQVYLNGTIVY